MSAAATLGSETCRRGWGDMGREGAGTGVKSQTGIAGDLQETQEAKALRGGQDS